MAFLLCVAESESPAAGLTGERRYFLNLQHCDEKMQFVF